MLTFPQCNLSLEFPEIHSQNLLCYHWLSVSGSSKIMHCGILFNMPYSSVPILVAKPPDYGIYYWAMSEQWKFKKTYQTPCSIQALPSFLNLEQFSQTQQDVRQHGWYEAISDWRLQLYFFLICIVYFIVSPKHCTAILLLSTVPIQNIFRFLIALIHFHRTLWRKHLTPFSPVSITSGFNDNNFCTLEQHYACQSPQGRSLIVRRPIWVMSYWSKLNKVFTK